MYKVFDAHTHTYPEKIAAKAVKNLGEFYDFVPEGDGTYDGLSANAENYGVRGFLLFSVATNAHQVTKVNDCIASLAEKSRGQGFQTVGFAGMHQDYPDFEGEIDRCIKLGLNGVKIHPDIQGVDIDDERMYRLYAIMQERGLPVFFHMGDNRAQYRFSEAKKLCRVLDDFPCLEVVAAHLGGYMAWDDALEYLTGRDRIWYDTSSALWAMTPERAGEIIHSLGVDRVMFGTDFPVKKLPGELERFLKIPLDEKERHDFLYNNAARFLHLDTLEQQ